MGQNMIDPQDPNAGKSLLVKEYTMPSFNGIYSTIARPVIFANKFRVDSIAMQAIRGNRFNGLSAEDHIAHMNIFLNIVNKIK